MNISTNILKNLPINSIRDIILYSFKSLRSVSFPIAFGFKEKIKNYKKGFKKMSATDNFYKELLDNIYDGVYFIDAERRIIYWNKGAENITGYSANEVMHKYCFDNILMHVNESNEKLCENSCPLKHTIMDGKNREAAVFFHHKNGHRVSTTVKASAIRDAEGKIIGAVEIFNDNSSNFENIEMLKILEKEALVDSLTGIVNRRYLEKRITASFNAFQRYGWKFGVLFMDIDHFKNVNDKFGHNNGDNVLKVLSKTLIKNIRSFDTVGRWGGEEFIGIIENVNKEELLKIAEKLRALVDASSIQLEGFKKNINPTISIGATISKPEDSPETIIMRADELMYESKQTGRNRVTIA
jgi:diguanylate cyclase (GGDEF)-like protein/PAS domain S-box-containing protein